VIHRKHRSDLKHEIKVNRIYSKVGKVPLVILSNLNLPPTSINHSGSYRKDTDRHHVLWFEIASYSINLYRQMYSILGHFSYLGSTQYFWEKSPDQIIQRQTGKGEGGIQVKLRLGTTQRSLKASTFGTFLKTLFATCAKSALTQRP